MKKICCAVEKSDIDDISKIVPTILTDQFSEIGKIHTKVTEIFSATSCCDCDIIGLSETWLQDNIQDSELLNDLTTGGNVYFAVKE